MTHPAVTATDLVRVPFLAGLPEADLAELAREARRAALPAGQVLYRPADLIHAVYFIQRGCIALLLRSDSGKEVIHSLITPTGFLNATAAGPEQRQLKQAFALVDTDIVVLPRERFDELLLHGGPFVKRVVAYLGFRLAELSRQVIFQLDRPLAWRVAHALLDVSEALETTELPITQDVLAALAAGTREPTATVLAKFRSEGWIRTRRGRIEIRDAEALARYIAAD